MKLTSLLLSACLCLTIQTAFAADARTVVLLDGEWQIAEGGLDSPPATFAHRVPVPGLVDMAKPAFAEVGVLIDPAGERILVGTPLLIRSTLLRLVYLDPNYSERFQLFVRKSTASGEEVVAWKIDWND